MPLGDYRGAEQILIRRSHRPPLQKTHTGADWAPRSLEFAGGPVAPPARWTATSNVEVGQWTRAYSVNIRRVERERREGSEGESHKGRREWIGGGTWDT